LDHELGPAAGLDSPRRAPLSAGTSGEVPCLSGHADPDPGRDRGPPPVAGAAAPVLPALRWDPRLYQIATLSGLLGYGVFWLDLEVQTRTAVAIIVMALVTQLVCTHLTGRGRFDPRSALISALSLCLLLP